MGNAARFSPRALRFCICGDVVHFKEVVEFHYEKFSNIRYSVLGPVRDRDRYFRKCWAYWLSVYGVGNSNVVRNARAASNCSAKLGVRPGMDDAFCDDGRCVVLGVATAKAAQRRSPCAVSVWCTAWIKRVVVADLFWHAGSWRGVCGNSFALACDSCNHRCICSNFTAGGLAPCTVSVVGELCDDTQLRVLDGELGKV